MVWHEANDSATGGGVSEFFPLPSYQSGAKVPVSVNSTKFKGRGVPDLAAVADPETGYNIYLTWQNRCYWWHQRCSTIDGRSYCTH